MIDMMDIGAEQGKQSRNIVEEELTWMDSLISDGRRFQTSGNCPLPYDF